ncbi:MAG: hypothetical protein VW258_00985 [Thalassolituus sp.]
MNLKHFYNQTTFTLTILVVVGGTVASPTVGQQPEITHRFKLLPQHDYKLEYGTLECCFIRSIMISYEDSGVRYQALQEVLSEQSSLSRLFNEGSYLAVTQVSPPVFESDA